MEISVKLSLSPAANMATRVMRSGRPCVHDWQGEPLLLAGWLPFSVQPQLSKPGKTGAAVGQGQAGHRTAKLGWQSDHKTFPRLW